MVGHSDIRPDSRPCLEGTEHKVSLQLFYTRLSAGTLVQDTNLPAGILYKIVSRYKTQTCLQVHDCRSVICRYRTQDKSVGRESTFLGKTIAFTQGDSVMIIAAAVTSINGDNDRPYPPKIVTAWTQVSQFTMLNKWR